MIVFLNGSFLPADQARVSVFDRGFLYGDGLFETVRAYGGRLFLWDFHLERLRHGLEQLRLRAPPEADALESTALKLLALNSLSDATLRIAISRGPGPRGYSPRDSGPPTLVVTAEAASPLESPTPTPSRLHTSRFRVPCGSPLTAVKSAGKLLNVLARAEAEAAGADEALLLNELGHISETAAANIFWFDPDGVTVSTPDLATGALAGVTRRLALDILRDLRWQVRLADSRPEELLRCLGAFLTVSTRGFVEVSAVDGHPLRRDPRFEILRARYREAVIRVISD